MSYSIVAIASATAASTGSFNAIPLVIGLTIPLAFVVVGIIVAFILFKRV